ncbi:MAG: aldo/keto reductase [Spirochaetes bacterium]|nr:aldo/keto reductase [Spirochaetota bacterium]
MQYRIDKKSGEKLSALGLGCMRFPRTLGVIDMRKTEELIMRAIEGGINYFDTAWFYPGSEETLGAILEKNKARERINITTKLPLVFLKNAADFDKVFDKQLARLRTGHIDYYLMHAMSDMTQWNELKSWGLLEWLAGKKKSGQIRRIGFSFHGRKEDFFNIVDDYDWELCMIQYNYYDENYQAGAAGLKKAAEKMPVVVMEPLLGGKLASGLPKEAVELFQTANTTANATANAAATPAGWALNWLWNQTEVTQVLSGMSDLKQLEENLALADAARPGMLSDDDHAVYKGALEIITSSYKVRCTGCDYCMPCPKGVNIPGCFASYNTSFSMGYTLGMKLFVHSTGGTAERPGSPGRCINCGKCEPLCPQSIPIMAELEKVRRRMEPLWFRFLMYCAALFLRRGKRGSKEPGSVEPPTVR